MPLPQVGDRVAIVPAPPVTAVRTGTCRFVGTTQFGDGVWVGVELDTQFKGKNTGSVQGVQYFQCAPEQGIFVRPELVEFLGHGTASSGNEAALRHDLEVLQTTLAAAEARIEELQLDVELHLEEKLALEDEVRLLKAAAALGHSGASEAAVTIAALQARVHEQEGRISELKDTVSELKVRLDSTSGDAQNERTLVQMMEQKLELEDQIAELRKQIEQHAAEKEELRQLSILQDEEIAEHKALEAALNKQMEATLAAQVKSAEENSVITRQLRDKINEVQLELAELRQSDSDASIRHLAAALRNARHVAERHLREISDRCAEEQIRSREDQVTWLRNLLTSAPSLSAAVKYASTCSGLTHLFETVYRLIAGIRQWSAVGVEVQALNASNTHEVFDLQYEDSLQRFELLFEASATSRQLCKISTIDPDEVDASLLTDAVIAAAHASREVCKHTLDVLSSKLSSLESSEEERLPCSLGIMLSHVDCVMDLLYLVCTEVSRLSSFCDALEALRRQNPLLTNVLQQVLDATNGIKSLISQIQSSGITNNSVSYHHVAEIETVLNWCTRSWRQGMERVRQPVSDFLSGVTQELRSDDVVEGWNIIIAGDGTALNEALATTKSSLQRLWHEAEKSTLIKSWNDLAVERFAQLNESVFAHDKALSGASCEASGPSDRETELERKLQAAQLSIAKLKLQVTWVDELRADIERASREKRELEARFTSTSAQFDEYIEQLENENSELKRTLGDIRSNLEAARRAETLGITEVERMRYISLITTRNEEFSSFRCDLFRDRWNAWSKSAANTSVQIRNIHSNLVHCHIVVPIKKMSQTAQRERF